MSKKHKTKPARPHWERVVRHTPNGAETVVPDSGHECYGFLKKGSTKKAPGK